LETAGLHQYEISNFSRDSFRSKHNLRYWERRPYLGVGLDASSALALALHAAASRTRDVLRAKTTDDLKEYLAGPRIAETAWLSSDQQHEEAWFLGLRLNAGVSVAALEKEFEREMVEPAMEIVARLVQDGLLTFDGETVRLTARGRLISNDVFQEFLQPEVAETSRRG
jgi:oxygen-independent coproporphyrinogen-3 oxidase